ncbi:MAG TPA: hypothetical protein VL171_03355 [Verrucomicrobiae bacterium]|nr:hypothetical protein [Verrucomicrobiae bacterium]
MPRKKPAPPKWITVRLGEDLNWWLEEASSDVYAQDIERGLLDPHQIAYLKEALVQYRPYGYGHELLSAAFQLFQIESELSESSLRLTPIDREISGDGDQLFALPLLGDGEMGAYGELLDVITSARIRKLNATCHFARACTDLEMQEELDAIDRDRYFASENIHTFDEINEILEWSPAEWDDSSSA